MHRLTRRATLAAVALLPLSRPRAQGAWRPASGVRIIAPAAAGGTTDIMARLLAQHLQPRWGVPVVAENRTGAGGTIGTLELVRARPDGLTLMSGNIGPQAIAYALFRNLSYTPDQVLPICGTIRGPNVLVVGPNVPARTVPEFAAWLRANPGRISYASSGVGQSTHLSPVWMLQMLGAQAIHVPYRGSAPAQTALLAGDNAFLMDNLTGIIELIRAGRVRALAVTSAARNPQLPDVPALRETLPELANYDVSTWFGLFAPAGLAPEVLDAIGAETRAWLELPDTVRRFAELGGEPFPDTPANFARFVGAEIEKWAGVIRREGLQMEAG